MAGMLLVAGAALAAGHGSVGGQVTDPQGRPVADAKITFAQDRDSPPRETRADADGRYAFYGLPTGAYELVAAAPGFVDVSRTVHVATATNGDGQFAV